VFCLFLFGPSSLGRSARFVCHVLISDSNSTRRRYFLFFFFFFFYVLLLDVLVSVPTNEVPLSQRIFLLLCVCVFYFFFLQSSLVFSEWNSVENKRIKKRKH
jgi:hypothetical protein